MFYRLPHYERFFSIAVNALGAPGVFVIRSREVSVTRRFSMSMVGLSQLCFKICPLCFLAMLQNFAYYAPIMLQNIPNMPQIFLHECLPCGFVAFKRDADMLALDIWPNFRASSMFPRLLLRSRSRSHC